MLRPSTEIDRGRAKEERLRVSDRMGTGRVSRRLAQDKYRGAQVYIRYVLGDEATDKGNQPKHV